MLNHRVWFWLVLLAGVTARLYGITNPLLDNHAWRQADTASMAANFLEYGFFPMLPQLNYDGPGPNYAELEFPVIPLLVAALWKLLGQSDLIARAVAVSFATGTLALVYLLGKEIYDRKSGLLAMAFFTVNPMAIYYGRSVMPEGPMLFFATAAVYHLVRWVKTDSFRALGLSSLCFALAVLSKLPALMLAPPLLALGTQKHKLGLVKTKEFWFFVLIGFLPALGYYYEAHHYASAKYVSSIVQMQASLGPSMDYLGNSLKRMVTGPLIITALIGPFLRKARVGNLFLWVWLAILLTYTLSVGARIQLEYYLYPLVPALCVLAGGTLGKFWEEAPGVISGLLILGICFNTAIKELKNYYDVDYGVLNQARIIEKATLPHDLLVLSDAPPMTFYYSNRNGWRLLPGQQKPERLEDLRAKGAKVFVILPGSEPDSALTSYLDDRYIFKREGNYYLLGK